MPIWRYTFVIASPFGKVIRVDGIEVVWKKSFFEYADELGSDGWELVSTVVLVTDGNQKIQYSFKRPD